jgi:predicted ATPase/DNA-binding winged helix-turn-helix (wHTH) protein
VNALLSARGQNLVFEYGQWQIDLGRRELLSNGVAAPIGARAFEILGILLQSANDLVTKDDILNSVWPGAVVGENTLQVHISAIRKALGPDRALLKTASGRGYRLLGNWTPRQPGSVGALSTSPPMRAPRTPSGAALLNNAPMLVGRLIGRAAAARHVRDLVSAYRVVTLTGIGGIGKTSLAIEAARGLGSDFEAGAWFVELASLSDPDLVPSTVAGTLGLKLTGEVSADSVARAVGAKRLLLVLDNCEHVIDAAAGLAERFTSLCPHATILATSRELLRIAGEAVWRVPPLDVPALGQDTPDHVLSHSAVQLFITRLNALGHGFSPHAEELASVAAICRQLDGIPLAIEFAAASAAMLGTALVAAGLRDRFALLTSGRRTALPRHRTLRAVLDWSYELLSEAERRLFRHLAIFSGGFTVEAATAVANEGAANEGAANEGVASDRAGDAASVIKGIADLVTKSLVTLDHESGSRWYLLETTRVYGLEKLADSGEASRAARRHAAFCLAFFGPFGTAGQLQAAIDELERYRAEVGNLRAELNWAFSDGGDPDLGVALAAAAADFWAAASLLPEACEWADKALARISGAAGTRHGIVLRCSFGTARLLTSEHLEMSRSSRRTLRRRRIWRGESTR